MICLDRTGTAIANPVLRSMIVSRSWVRSMIAHAAMYGRDVPADEMIAGAIAGMVATLPEGAPRPSGDAMRAAYVAALNAERAR